MQSPSPAEDAPGPDQKVYETIRASILEHRLPPGTKLTEEKLSALLGVSRERIRKVILRLAHDKCVELIPNRGAFVAQPGIQEAREVFAARRLIESHLLDLVAQRAQAKDFALLEANVATERLEHDQGLFEAAVSTSGNFHLILAEASGNSVLSEILQDLVARSSLILAMYSQSRFSLCGMQEHREIVDRLRTGQVARAKKLLLSHLQDIEDQLRFDDRGPRAVDLADVFRAG